VRALVQCKVSIVSHDAAQFRISSCHQVSHGVLVSSSVEIVEARFMAWQWLVQSGDGAIKNPAGESGVRLLRR
jgi:hypothetical protein